TEKFQVAEAEQSPGAPKREYSGNNQQAIGAAQLDTDAGSFHGCELESATGRQAPLRWFIAVGWVSRRAVRRTRARWACPRARSARRPALSGPVGYAQSHQCAKARAVRPLPASIPGSSRLFATARSSCSPADSQAECTRNAARHKPAPLRPQA